MEDNIRASGRNVAGVQAGGPDVRTLVARAFGLVMGFQRLIFYDLPLESAPTRLSRSGISLRGSGRWRAYLEQRRRFDSGDLTLVVALRQLGDDERLLAVNWGTAHANTFLLIEPLSGSVDLTSAADPIARAFWGEAEAVGASGDITRLADRLRTLYGAWVYWPAPPATAASCRRLDVHLGQGTEPLFTRLQAVLARTFPPSAFQENLARLLKEESELFIGRSVERARSPFLTRLGLPAFYEPSLVTGALRRMVNAGQASVAVAGGAGTFRGPEVPIPDEVPNELFERMLL